MVGSLDAYALLKTLIPLLSSIGFVLDDRNLTPRESHESRTRLSFRVTLASRVLGTMPRLTRAYYESIVTLTLTPNQTDPTC